MTVSQPSQPPAKRPMIGAACPMLGARYGFRLRPRIPVEMLCERLGSSQRPDVLRDFGRKSDLRFFVNRSGEFVFYIVIPRAKGGDVRVSEYFLANERPTFRRKRSDERIQYQPHVSRLLRMYPEEPVEVAEYAGNNKSARNQMRHFPGAQKAHRLAGPSCSLSPAPSDKPWHLIK